MTLWKMKKKKYSSIDNKAASIMDVVKLSELRFELLPYLSCSPSVVPSDYYLFADLERMLMGKRFSLNKTRKVSKC